MSDTRNKINDLSKSRIAARAIPRFDEHKKLCKSQSKSKVSYRTPEATEPSQNRDFWPFFRKIGPTGPPRRPFFLPRLEIRNRAWEFQIRNPFDLSSDRFLAMTTFVVEIWGCRWQPHLELRTNEGLPHSSGCPRANFGR